MIFRVMRLAISVVVLQLAATCSLAAAQTAPNTNNQHINLLQRYPTTLSTGYAEPGEAREWKFSKEDIYFLSEFSLKIGNALEIKIGPADIGIGHCVDGAVWAVVIPKESGTLNSSVNTESELIDHLWLRFHPAEIITLFPESTVEIAGDEIPWPRMLKIANTKFQSSWQAGGRAMIPGRNDLTVDADIKEGKRRFFVVDTKTATARYVSGFENRIVPEDKPFSKDLAKSSFDRLWEEYDRKYAMFTLRPEIKWEKLRGQYRPQALECTTAYEFALVCAEMLKHLRDLHIWVKADGQNVPVFNRPRERNANPSAFESIIGKLDKVDKKISWAKTKEKIGFIAINSWSGDVDQKFDEVLENMRDTRGLIIDVRLNGGGSEPLAEKVASRFVDKEYIYAYSQFRNGPNHADLTEKYPRKVEPRGPWRYDRPVVLLMGRKCMSSNESFVSMMAESPQVTTMGDHTCGSSGNPKFLDLPAGVRVSLPQWIDLLPDKTPLDGRGVQPDIYFPTKQEDFEGVRDDLLRAAVEKLSEEPLPEGPIEGPDIRIAKAEERASRPSVIEVWPKDGDTDIDPDTEIRIKFDRLMNPLLTNLRWETGTCVEYRNFSYDKTTNEFVFSVRLEADCQHTIYVNKHTEIGDFSDNNESIANQFKWSFHTRNLADSSDKDRPKIVLVLPPPGSKLPLVSELKVQFDKPMDPDYYGVSDTEYRSRRNSCNALLHHIRYDVDSQTFTIPIVLPPVWEGKVELNYFRDSDGIWAESVAFKYSTGKELLATDIKERLKKASASQKLIEVLENVRKVSLNTEGISEKVMVMNVSRNRMHSECGVFRMQGDKQFYADASKFMMSNRFLIGSNGQQCWWYYRYNDFLDNKMKEKLIVVPYADINEKSVTICDPFQITDLGVDGAIDKYKLEYVGAGNLDGRTCHMIRSWYVELQPEHRRFNVTSFRIGIWWIDSVSHRLTQIEDNWGSSGSITHFVYNTTNSAKSNFGYSQFTDIESTEPESLNHDYDARFLKVIDGSNGRMSVRWGRYGPAGRISSGLN